MTDTHAGELQSSYDFVVCGSGSSGSVVAGRLAETGQVSVLLLEAGGSDDGPSVQDAGRWFENIGTQRDWEFRAASNPQLNDRRLSLAMGKLLGGGSSINAMIWSRGHRNDWDYFAAEAKDPSWNYDSILRIYRRIEDWHGVRDSLRRGEGGLLYIEPARDPNPLAPAMLEATRHVGLPIFDDQNGVMMEGAGGAAITNLRIRGGRRQSVFRSYCRTESWMRRNNLTVLTGALVTRVLFDGKRAVGIEFLRNGQWSRIAAACEVVLSLGAINTPKVLLQSGIGDADDLARVGVDLVQHLPGVGRNFQDHIIAGCHWEHKNALPPRNNGVEATSFWKSNASLDTPDLQSFIVEFPLVAPGTADDAVGAASWGICPTVVRPLSRGQVRITGPKPCDPVEIETGTFSDPADLKAMMRGIQMCRELGNYVVMNAFAKREVMPGDLAGPHLKILSETRRRVVSIKAAQQRWGAMTCLLLIAGFKFMGSISYVLPMLLSCHGYPPATPWRHVL